MGFDLREVSVLPSHQAGSAMVEPVLHELNVSAQAGEQIALIGPSGAGKTTLLHTLACAQRPAQGTLQLYGQDPWVLSNRSRQAVRATLFLAPQTPPLPPRQRVITAVLAGRLPQWSLWKAIGSLIRPRDTAIARAALARVHLEDKLFARVDRLSGGERQRTAIARLLVSQARMLFVDEPLSALDPSLARDALSVLQAEAKIRSATLVCSLHQVELAREFFPRLIGLRNGQIAFDLPSQAVTDDMIAMLYQHSITPAPVLRPDRQLQKPMPAPRCF